MKKPVKTEIVSVRLDRETKEWADACADAEDRPLSSWLARLIANERTRRPPKARGRHGSTPGSLSQSGGRQSGLGSQRGVSLGEVVVVGGHLRGLSQRSGSGQPAAYRRITMTILTSIVMRITIRDRSFRCLTTVILPLRARRPLAGGYLPSTAPPEQFHLTRAHGQSTSSDARNAALARSM